MEPGDNHPRPRATGDLPALEATAEELGTVEIRCRRCAQIHPTVAATTLFLIHTAWEPAPYVEVINHFSRSGRQALSGPSPAPTAPRRGLDRLEAQREGGDGTPFITICKGHTKQVRLDDRLVEQAVQHYASGHRSPLYLDGRQRLHRTRPDPY